MWESGQNVPGTGRLVRLASELGVSMSWLLTGVKDTEEDVRESSKTVAMMMDVMGTRDDRTHDKIVWDGDAIDQTPRPPALMQSRNAYALFVQGKRMSPRYNEGEMIYVHPDLPVVPDNHVLILLGRDEDKPQRAILGQYVRHTEKGLLIRQYNPRRELEIPDEQMVRIDRIVGTWDKT